MVFFGYVAIGTLNAVSTCPLPAQDTDTPAAIPVPVVFTTQEDHRNMRDQLGITKLRFGPDGNESAPNHANYDEALANPYPNLPELLTLKNGEQVTTPEMWWNRRRPEIVEEFEREVYGRVPKHVPVVTWTVTETRETTAGDLPVDSHQLITLCAPRLTFISYGVPQKGDAKWLDQQGSFMAAVAAGPAFRLLGARDLGTSDDYRTEKMPAVNEGLLAGELAWRQHDGGHTDGPNIEHFLKWAESHFRRP